MTSDAPRYADCPSVEVDVLIDAPPPAVWELVSDIDLPARFSPEFQGARWVDPSAGPAVGSRFVGRNEYPTMGVWETTCRVVEYEAPKVFGWVVEAPPGEPQPSCSWRFTLEPRDGGTRLVQWARIGPGPSGLTMVIESMPEKEQRIVAHRLREFRTNMTATVNGIKGLAEAGGR